MSRDTLTSRFRRICWLQECVETGGGGGGGGGKSAFVVWEGEGGREREGGRGLIVVEEGAGDGEAMDVVDGKIVSARMEPASAEPGSGMRAPERMAERGEGNPEYCGGSDGDWAPSWATGASFGEGGKAWGGAGAGAGACHGPASGLALEPKAARWSQRASAMVESHSSAFQPGPGAFLPGLVAVRPWSVGFHPRPVSFQPRPVAEHRQGWGGGDQQHRHDQARAFSEKNMDQMMAMYESAVTRTVSGNFAKAVGISALGHENPTLDFLSKDGSLQRSVSDARYEQDSEAQSSFKATLVRSNSDLKRKRLEIKISEEGDHADWGWSHPLRILVRKGLSLSDVGELGRIVIPKKDAESQFQQLETKEGPLLQMEDYACPKRWFFRFKWWINNKSRMYVLENTGEFIKYHNLKEHDIFIVYEDGLNKMVVRGHKGTDLNSTCDALHGTNLGSCSGKLPSAREEGRASTTALA